jgi:hypothetical protein
MKSISTLLLVAGIASAGRLDAETPAAKGFAVVELFTSQGCSSCPPADKLLSEISADARAKRQRVFAVAFHVDYWNHLGWTDPFSSKAFSLRQHAYAEKFGSTRVYTPQAVVNGTTEFVGSDRSRMQRSIAAALSRPARAKLTLRRIPHDQSGKIVVAYEVADATGEAVLNVALIERGLVTKVPRGENAGRSLTHDNVARVFESVPLRGKRSGEIVLPPPDGLARARSAVVGYVQEAGAPAVLAADGFDLETSAR